MLFESYYTRGEHEWNARNLEAEIEDYKEQLDRWYPFAENEADEEDYMDWVADSAYYNDGCMTNSTEEAYFVIYESIGESEANEFLLERLEADTDEIQRVA